MSEARGAMTAGDRKWLLAAWLPYAVLVKAFWFVTDDAFISFRYARNLALGHGLRYNPGEVVPVEGYSNFLWVLWCAVAERLGVSVAHWATATSFAAGSVLLLLVYRALRVRFALEPRVAALAALALGAFPPFFVWSTGGLATMPFALAVFWMFDRLALREGGPSVPAAALAGLAAALLRVEGFAWVVLVAAGAAWSHRAPGERAGARILATLGIVAAGFGAFLLWRHGYHGAWVSNTAQAKVGMSAALLARGAEYVLVIAVTFLTPLLLVPAAAMALRREHRALGLPLLALTGAAAGYAVAVGGDFMAMGRLLVPGLPFAALLIGGWLGSFALAGRPATAMALGGSTILLGLLPAADVHVVPESIRARFDVREHFGKRWTEMQYWNVMRLNGERWKRLGLALKEIAPAGASVVCPGIGNIGYWSGLVVHDQAGLVDRQVALRPSAGLAAPGHDKMVSADFFLSRRPDLISPVLVVEGGEERSTLEALRREAERLRDGWDVRYEPETHELPPGAGRPGPIEAEEAVLVNLAAPFGLRRTTDGPREIVVFLRRSEE